MIEWGYMQILLTLGKDKGAGDYVIRPTVKGVVLDDKNNVLLFSDLLIGGEVEYGETFEQALQRECMEEAGIHVDIIKPLGTVIQYREFLKKKYEVHGFLVITTGVAVHPTTLQEDEVGKKVKWMKLADARKMLEGKIQSLKELDPQNTVDDGHQGKLYNSLTALTFLNEVKVLSGAPSRN